MCFQARSCKASMTSMNRTSEICTVPTFLVCKDWLLTYLLVSVPSIFTLRYQVPRIFLGLVKEVGNIACIFWRNIQRVTSYLMNKKDPFIFTNLTIIWSSNMFWVCKPMFEIYYARIVVVLYSFVMPKRGHFLEDLLRATSHCQRHRVFLPVPSNRWIS